MLIKKSQRVKQQISKNGTVWEYNFPSKKISFATAKLNGRIPDSGRMRNKVCIELYYVISGTGTLFIENKRYKLKEGDVFFIKPGKRYYLAAKNLYLALPTVPAWSKKQWEHIKN